MKKRRMDHKEMKILVKKVIEDCRELAIDYKKKWKPVDKKWNTIEGAVYLRLSDDSQVAVERGSLEQQIHIAVTEAEYRSEQEKINYKITDFYIEPGITGRHDNRPEFIRLQQNICSGLHKFIIFKEISRIVRDVEIWKRFFKLCQTYDCEICIRGLPFNPNDPASILQLDQLAAYAEFESRTTSKRIKESVHSALITSGKFNSNYSLLGFDVQKNKFGENSGIFKPNKAELKQVTWIFKTFLRVPKLKDLLDECKRQKINNKFDREFSRNSLRRILESPRYIGKWYRNSHNKDKRQSKLMPYDRYVEVSFDYGEVIDRKLWDDVQKKLELMNKNSCKGQKRSYPLSGLLTNVDGTSFSGQSATGRNTKLFYYYNRANKVRVSADKLEETANNTIYEIINKSPEFKKALSKYNSQKNEMLSYTDDKISHNYALIEKIKTDQDMLNKRLNFLLEDDDLAMAREFKAEYKEKRNQLRNEKNRLEAEIRNLNLIKQQAENADAINENSLGFARKAVGFFAKKDLASLKAIYRSLFEKVVLNVVDDCKVELTFILKGSSSFLRINEDSFCIRFGMVEEN